MNHRNIHYTSFIVHCTYPFLLLLPFVVACSTTRAIPEGEQLYTGINETRFVDDPAELRKKKQRDSTGVITAVAKAVTAVKKDDTKPGFFKRIGKWFREMKSELKKVIWPTSQQLTKNSLISVGFMVVAAVVIWGFDRLASMLVQALITLAG